eukprot:Rhum_TRINITY_DN15440_c6_g1::Rhum_TRINITY_DN15440_c6_g1_i1::g.157142::m.157142
MMSNEAPVSSPPFTQLYSRMGPARLLRCVYANSSPQRPIFAKPSSSSSVRPPLSAPFACSAVASTSSLPPLPPPPPPPPREKQVRDMSPRRVSDPANTQAQQPTPQAHGGAGMVLPQSSGSVGAVPSPAPIARVSPARTSPVRVSPVRPARLDAAVAAPVSPRSPAAAATAADGGEEEHLRLRSKLAMQERQLEAFRKQVELQQGLVERAVGQLEARHTEKERGTERELRQQAAHDRELLLLSAAAQAQRTSPARRAPALPPPPEVRFDPNPVLALPLDEVLVACPAFRRNFDGCDATRRLEIRTSWGPGCAWLSPLLKECFLQDNFAPLGLPADTDAHPASLLSGVLPAGNAHHHHHPPHHPPYGAAAHNVAGGNARFDSATISPQRNRHAAVEVTPPPPQQHRALVSPSKRRPPPESSVQLVRSPAKPFPHASPPRPERTSASVQPPVAAAPTATAAPDAAISHGAWSAAPSGQPPPPLQHAQQQQPPSHHQQQVAPPSLYHHQPPPQSQPPSPSRQQQQQPLPATSLIEQGIANEIAFRTTPTTTTLTAAAPAATHHGDPSPRHTDDSAAAAAAAVRDAASLAEENRQLRRTVDELRATTAALEERVASWEAATADVQAECARRGEALAALRQEQQQQHRSVQRSDSVGAAEAATRKHDALLGALRARDARAAALEGEAASQSRRATAAEDECLLLGDAVREREAALRQAEGVLREKERHAAAQSCEMAELRARLARVEQQQQQQQQQQ